MYIYVLQNLHVWCGGHELEAIFITLSGSCLQAVVNLDAILQANKQQAPSDCLKSKQTRFSIKVYFTVVRQCTYIKWPLSVGLGMTSPASCDPRTYASAGVGREETHPGLVYKCGSQLAGLGYDKLSLRLVKFWALHHHLSHRYILTFKKCGTLTEYGWYSCSILRKWYI